jgi:hypothetical protein
MELEITPEPSPEEREAIERALARLLAEGADERSGWWREGVAENVAAFPPGERLSSEEERD